METNETVLITIPGRHMATTILDVAKLCGYSKATVSRAFASPQQVTEKTRQKVYAAARALNYTPDAIAQAMARGHTNNIGFVINEQQYPAVLNPFYSPIVEAVLQTSARQGYTVFIASAQHLRGADERLHIKKQLDGVILAGHFDTDTIVDLQRQNLPVVLLNNLVEMDDLCCITTDQYGGSVLAMEHLIRKGHKKIGLVAGRFSPYVYSARYNGYMDTLRAHGLEADMRFVQTIEPTVEDAIECVRMILCLEDRPTALFCTNDTIAIGAVKAVLRAGLSIPGDMAVIGFDDSDISRMIEPELSTIHIETTQMGRLAAERLIRLVQGKKETQQRVQTEVKLVERQTT